MLLNAGLISSSLSGSYPASQTNRYVPSSVVGATWNDQIASSNITLTSTTFSDNAVNFNGTSSWGQFPSAMLPLTSNFGVSVYCFPTNYSAGRAIFSQVLPGAGGFGRVLLFSGSPSNFRSDIYEPTGSGSSFFSINQTGFTANWHLITFTRSGNVFNLYIDGVLGGSQTLSGVTLASAASRLGRYIDGASSLFFLGKIRYVGICNATISLAEHQAEYTRVLSL